MIYLSKVIMGGAQCAPPQHLGAPKSPVGIGLSWDLSTTNIHHLQLHLTEINTNMKQIPIFKNVFIYLFILFIYLFIQKTIFRMKITSYFSLARELLIALTALIWPREFTAHADCPKLTVLMLTPTHICSPFICNNYTPKHPLYINTRVYCDSHTRVCIVTALHNTLLQTVNIFRRISSNLSSANISI